MEGHEKADRHKLFKKLMHFIIVSLLNKQSPSSENPTGSYIYVQKQNYSQYLNNQLIPTQEIPENDTLRSFPKDGAAMKTMLTNQLNVQAGKKQGSYSCLSQSIADGITRNERKIWKSVQEQSRSTC